ncbi:hypothetical protein CPC08DRAFT_705044 [Agrocybe pediades]|nr:hypothetical protein CPC08DRAFT_705044 [Agrocybe pediades]
MSADLLCPNPDNPFGAQLQDVLLLRAFLPLFRYTRFSLALEFSRMSPLQFNMPTLPMVMCAVVLSINCGSTSALSGYFTRGQLSSVHYLRIWTNHMVSYSLLMIYVFDLKRSFNARYACGEHMRLSSRPLYCRACPVYSGSLWHLCAVRRAINGEFLMTLDLPSQLSLLCSYLGPISVPFVKQPSCRDSREVFVSVFIILPRFLCL